MNRSARALVVTMLVVPAVILPVAPAPADVLPAATIPTGAQSLESVSLPGRFDALGERSRDVLATVESTRHSTNSCRKVDPAGYAEFDCCGVETDAL